MDESRTEAPELELTAAPADAEDALQLGPIDLPAAATPAGDDPFAMHLADRKPAPADPAKNLKPSKPISAAANQSMVAALMGLPIAKNKNALKSAVANVRTATPVSTPANVFPAEDKNAATEVADRGVEPGAVAEVVAPLAPIEESATSVAASDRDSDTSTFGASNASEPILSSDEIAASEDEAPDDIALTPFEPTAFAEPEAAAEPAVIEPVFEVIHAKTFNVDPVPAEAVKADEAPAAEIAPAETAPVATPAAPIVVAASVPVIAAEPMPAVMSGVNVAAVPAARPVEPVAPTKTESTPAAPVIAAPAPAAPAKVRQPLFAKPPTPPAVPIFAKAEPARPAEPPRRAIPVAPVWPAAPADVPTPAKPARQASPKAMAAAPLFDSQPAKVETVDTDETEDAIDLVPPREPSTGAWWTIPLTFVGIAIVACAVLIPAADENRRTGYELAKIQQDVNYFQKQSDVNQDFLKRINTDATLAERLAMRQLHQTRPGVKLAPIAGHNEAFGGSPYAMTRLDPPPALPPYEPVPGKLTEWFLGDQKPQQMASLGLIVAGAGVMLGGLRTRKVRPLLPTA